MQETTLVYDKEIEGNLVTAGEEEPQITLHALSGHNTNNTIRLLGMANGKFIRILVDNGSSINNFLWILKQQKGSKLLFLIQILYQSQ